MYHDDQNKKMENGKGFREKLRRLSAMVMAVVMLMSSAPLPRWRREKGRSPFAA